MARASRKESNLKSKLLNLLAAYNHLMRNLIAVFDHEAGKGRKVVAVYGSQQAHFKAL